MEIGILLFQYYHGQVGGAGDYIMNLLLNLPKFMSQDDELILIGSRKNLASLKGRLDGKAKFIEVSYSDGYIKALRLFNALGASLITSGLARKVASLGLDVILCPQQNLFPRQKAAPAVVMFHDLQHLHLPDNFSRWKRAVRRSNDLYSVENADALITNSNATKMDMVEALGAKEESIEVAYLGANKFNESDRDSSPLIDGPYLFYPANNYPHKNHVFLLDAFKRLSDKKGIPGLKLVLAGKIYPRGESDIRSRLNDYIIHVGYVSSRDLYRLYYNCQAVVFPSLFEGFGMPIIEAMHFGKPMICSDLPVIRELVGEVVKYFLPGDQHGMLARIEEVMLEKVDEEALAAKYMPIISQFTWEECAKMTYGVLKRCCGH